MPIDLSRLPQEELDRLIAESEAESPAVASPVADMSDEELDREIAASEPAPSPTPGDLGEPGPAAAPGPVGGPVAGPAPAAPRAPVVRRQPAAPLQAMSDQDLEAELERTAPPRAGLGTVAKDALTGLASGAVDVLPKMVAQTIRGMMGGPKDVDSVRRHQGVLDDFIAEQDADIARRTLTGDAAEQKTVIPWLKRGDIQEGTRQWGNSALSMVASLAGTVGGAALGGRVGGKPGMAVGAKIGGALGGAAGMAPLYYSQLDEFYQMALKSRLADNPAYTQDEWDQERARLEPYAKAYARAEVGPEIAQAALSGALNSRLLGSGQLISALRKMGENVVAEVASEHLGETVTQKLQNNPLYQAGLADTPEITWAQAWKDVAAQVTVGTLTTSLMLGGPTVLVDRVQFARAKSKSIAALEESGVPPEIVRSMAGARNADEWEAAVQQHGEAIARHFDQALAKNAAGPASDEGGPAGRSPRIATLEADLAQLRASGASQEAITRAEDMLEDERALEALGAPSPTATAPGDALRQGEGSPADQRNVEALRAAASGRPAPAAAAAPSPVSGSAVDRIVRARAAAGLPDLEPATVESLRQREGGLGAAISPRDEAVFSTMRNVAAATPSRVPAKAGAKGKDSGLFTIEGLPDAGPYAIVERLPGGMARVLNAKNGALTEVRDTFLRPFDVQAAAASRSAPAPSVAPGASPAGVTPPAAAGAAPGARAPLGGVDLTATRVGQLSASGKAAVAPAEEKAVTPKGAHEVGYRWAVMDAGDVISSYDQGYPLADLQPRDRTSVASDQQVIELAGKWDPEQAFRSRTTDTGAVFISPDGYVVSGNGRTGALRLAYQDPKAGPRIYARVLEQAKELGLDASTFPHPILVRVLTNTGKLDMRQVAEASNARKTLAYSPAEQAKLDAKAIMDGSLVESFDAGESENIMAASNRPFLTAFQRATGDESMLNRDGSFNSDVVVPRVQRALLVSVMGDGQESQRIANSAIERGEELGIRRPLLGVMQAGGRLLRLASVKPPFDIRADLTRAIHELTKYRADVLSGKAIDLDQYLAQQDFLSTPLTPAARILLGELASRPSAKDVREFLGQYAQLAEAEDTKTGMLFGGMAPATAADLLKRAAGTAAVREPAAAYGGRPPLLDHPDLPRGTRLMLRDAVALRARFNQDPALATFAQRGSLPLFKNNGNLIDVLPGMKRAVLVPLSRLVLTKDELHTLSRPKGSSVEIATKRMLEVLRGSDSDEQKRAPLEVFHGEDGFYYVKDGNATAIALMLAGYDSVPVTVVGEIPADAPADSSRAAVRSAFSNASKNRELWKQQVDSFTAAAEKVLLETYGSDVVEKRTDEAKAFIARAQELIPLFRRRVSDAGALCGSAVKFGPVKTARRTMIKSLETSDKAALPVAQVVKDVLRATIVLEGMSDVEIMQIGRDVANQLGGVVKYDDRYAKPFASGYRHILIHFHLGDGVIAELQLNTPYMLEAKAIAHTFYEVQRTLPATAEARTREENEVFDEMERHMLDTYRAGYEAGAEAAQVVRQAARGEAPATAAPIARMAATLDKNRGRSVSSSEPAENRGSSRMPISTPAPETKDSTSPEGSIAYGSPSKDSKNLVPSGSAAASGIVPFTEENIARAQAEDKAKAAESVRNLLLQLPANQRSYAKAVALWVAGGMNGSKPRARVPIRADYRANIEAAVREALMPYAGASGMVRERGDRYGTAQMDLFSILTPAEVTAAVEGQGSFPMSRPVKAGPIQASRFLMLGTGQPVDVPGRPGLTAIASHRKPVLGDRRKVRVVLTFERDGGAGRQSSDGLGNTVDEAFDQAMRDFEETWTKNRGALPWKGKDESGASGVASDSNGRPATDRAGSQQGGEPARAPGSGGRGVGAGRADNPLADLPLFAPESRPRSGGKEPGLFPPAERVAGQPPARAAFGDLFEYAAVNGVVPAAPGGDLATPIRTASLAATARPGNLTPAAAPAARNLDLRTAPPVRLTKGTRGQINARVREILTRLRKDGFNTVTDEERDVLRQFTGEGGLSSGETIQALNQHFTDYETIEAIWRALEAAGVPMQNALEPGVGSGNFVGMRPDLDWTTVEIDKTASDVVRALYPRGRHYNVSFELFKATGFDLAISNVPFLETRSGAVFNRDIEALHDFYFVRSLDLVRPNGVVAFITSSGTMDKLSTSVREQIIGRADVLGAFRLPVGHFRKNAHTDVMTDLIILQRRPAGAKPGARQDQVNQAFVRVSQDVEGRVMNGYYELRPQHVLGKLSAGVDKLHGGKPIWSVDGAADLSKIAFTYKPYRVDATESPGALAAAVRPSSAETAPRAWHDLQGWVETQGWRMKSRIVTYTVDDKGNQQRHESRAEDFDTTLIIEDGQAWAYHESVELSDLEGIARLYKPVIESLNEKIQRLHTIAELAAQYQQTGDRGFAEQALAAIEAYRADIGVHPAQDRVLARTLGRDSSAYAEFSSFFGEDWKAADVFFEQTRYDDSGRVSVSPDSPLPMRAFASEDTKGMIQFANLAGLHVKPSEIATLLGSGYSIASVGESGLPVLHNDILYYSGNVYDKLDGIAALRERDDLPAEWRAALDRQAERLEAIRPMPKRLEEIAFVGVEPWLMDLLNATGLVTIGQKDDGKGVMRWSISGPPAEVQRLVENRLNNFALVSRAVDKEGQPTETEDQYFARLQQAERDVDTWYQTLKRQLRDNPDAAGAIELAYNRRFRSYVKPDYNAAAYLIEDVLKEVEEAKGFRPRQNTIEWVMQAVYEGRGINAHDVGGGKTLAGAILARVLKKRGMAKKPMFVVPAKVINNWEREILQAFPKAKVVNLGKLDGASRRRALFALANTNADYVLVSHEGFAQIALSRERELAYMQELLDENMANLTSDEKSQSNRELSKTLDRMKRFMDIIRNAPRDDRLTLDKLGVDSIVVDEAHNFKNIGISGDLVRFGLGIGFSVNERETAVKGVDGRPIMKDVVNPDTGEPIVNPKTKERQQEPVTETVFSLKSARSYDMRFKAQYISDQNNGGNVFLLTATPTPNKPMEIWTMLRHLSRDIFAEYGIRTDKQFQQQFLRLGQARNPNDLAVESVLTAIVNAQELRGILNRFVDKRSTAQMPWITPIPADRPVMHWMPQSVEYALIAADLKKREADLPTPQEREPGDDSILAIYTNARAASVDPRLYGGPHAQVEIDARSFDTEQDKIERVVQLVAEHAKADPKAGQVVFLDNAGHQQAKRGKLPEDVHTEIKRALIAAGLRPEQIAIINGKVVTDPETGKDTASGDRDGKKQAISDAYNAGKIRVVIGTTTSAGEGMNLQETTTDIYHVDFPWNPGAVRQRNGRGIRYKNPNPIVRTHFFFMRGTFDALSWALIAHKRGWNEAIWDKEVADVIPTAEEMVGGLVPPAAVIAIEMATDPLTKARLIVSWRHDRLAKRVREASDVLGGIQGEIYTTRQDLHESAAELERRKASRERLAPNIKIKDAAERAEAFEKSKAYADKLIASADRRVSDLNAKLATLLDRERSAVESRNLVRAEQEAFAKAHYTDTGDIKLGAKQDEGGPEAAAEALIKSYRQEMGLVDEETRLDGIPEHMLKIMDREHAAAAAGHLARVGKPEAGDQLAAELQVVREAPALSYLGGRAVSSAVGPVASVAELLKSKPPEVDLDNTDATGPNGEHSLEDMRAAVSHELDLAAEGQDGASLNTPSRMARARAWLTKVEAAIASGTVRENDQAALPGFEKPGAASPRRVPARKSAAPGRGGVVLSPAQAAAAAVLTARPGLTVRDVRQAFGEGRFISAFQLDYLREGAISDVEGMKLSTPQDVFAALWFLRSPLAETFKVLYMNAANRIIGAKVISTGGVDYATIDMRNVFAHAPPGTRGMILSHNHPSGDPSPSSEDIRITRQIVAGAQAYGLEVLDHVITNGKRYTSLRESGLVSFVGPDVMHPVEGKRARIPTKDKAAPPPALADWEIASLDDLPRIHQSDDAARFVALLRQANPDNGHALILNTRNAVIGILRFEATMSAQEITRLILRNSQGAKAVLIDAPASWGDANTLMNARRLVEAGRISQLEFLDVITADNKSLRDSGRVVFGVAEPGAWYRKQGFDDSLPRGIGWVNKGKVEFQDLTPDEFSADSGYHVDRFGWEAEISNSRFRTRFGKVIWTDAPSEDDLNAARNYLARRGLADEKQDHTDLMGEPVLPVPAVADERARYEALRAELEAATGETYSDEALDMHIAAAGGLDALGGPAFDQQLKPEAIEEVTPLPHRPPGPRWHTDPGAFVGEPILWIDAAHPEEAPAAIFESQDDAGMVLYHGAAADGRPIAVSGVLGDVVAAVERAIPGAAASESFMSENEKPAHLDRAGLSEKIAVVNGVERRTYFNRAGLKVGDARTLGVTLGDINVKASQRRRGYGLAIVRHLAALGYTHAIAGSREGAALLTKAGFRREDEDGGRFYFPGREDVVREPKAPYGGGKRRDTEAELRRQLAQAQATAAQQRKVNLRLQARLGKTQQKLAKASVPTPDDELAKALGPPLDWDEILGGQDQGSKRLRRSYARGFKAGAGSQMPIVAALDTAFGRRARGMRKASQSAKAALMETDAEVAADLLEGLPQDAKAARRAVYTRLRKMFGSVDAVQILKAAGDDGAAATKELLGYLGDELTTYYANRLLWMVGRRDFKASELHPDVRDEFEKLTKDMPYSELVELAGALDSLRWFKSEKTDANPADVEKAQKSVDELFAKWRDKLAAANDWRTIKDWHDRAAGVIAESRNLQWIVRQGVREARADVARRVNAEIAASAAPLAAVGRGEAPRGRGLREGLLEDLRLTQSGRALQMAGGREDSDTFRLLSSDIQDAERAKLDQEREIMDRFSAEQKRLGITDDDWVRWSATVNTYLLAGQEIQLTVAEVMDLYATIQDEENLAELARAPLKRQKLRGVKTGVRFEDADQAESAIRALTDRVLSDQQKELVRFMVGELTAMGDGGNEVSRQLYGKDLFTKPRYWPRVRDYLDRKNEAVGDIEDLRRGNMPRMLERLGLTKTRVKNVHALMVGNAALKFAAHVKQMSAYTHLTIPVGNAIGVLGYGDAEINVGSTLRERYGSKRIDEIRKTFERVSGLRRNSDDWGALQRFLNRVERNAAVAILWGRLTTILFNRLGGSIMAMGEIERLAPGGGVRYLKHLGLPGPLFWTKGNKAIRDTLMRNGYLWHRWNGDFINVQANYPTDDVEDVRTQAALKLRKVQAWGMQPMATAEQKNAVGMFKVFREMGLSEADAVLAVESVTRATQNPSSALEETPIYQDVKRAGLGVFLPFMGQPTVAASLLARDMIRVRNKRPGAVRALALTAWGLGTSVIMTAVVRALVRGATSGDWPPDDKERERLAAQAAAEGLDVLLPGSGKVFDVVSGFGDRGMARDTSILGRIVESSLGGARDLQKAAAGEADEGRIFRAVDRLATAASLALGLPYGGPMQAVKATAGAVGAPVPQVKPRGASGEAKRTARVPPRSSERAAG